MERPALESAGSGSNPGNGPHRSLERHELQRQVQRALERIDPEQREIILLRDFEGLDYATIAGQLEVAEGTVKSRLSRARAALREALRGHVTEADL